jgi:AraC-like DNA-binding protein
MRVVPEGCVLADGRMGVVGQALLYFTQHFRDAIEMTDVARVIGISEECLDFCFDQSRGMTPFEALQHHRLNRLFQDIAAHPARSLPRSMRQCGLPCSAGTIAAFEDTFGIGMPLFRRTCLRAAADREGRRRHPDREHLILLTPDQPRSQLQPPARPCRNQRRSRASASGADQRPGKGK